MADAVSVDFSEVNRLVADLGKTTVGLLPKVDAVVKKGADNVKKDLAAQASGSESFKGMAGSFSYDSAYRVGQVAYEIGPDKARRGGALGNIFFFGGANGGGGTGDLDGVLAREAGGLTKALGDVLGDVL